MADCCLIKKVATVEVYENKNEVRAYGFMAGDRNTPVIEVRFKHLWGESNLSSCKLRWIIVDDVGSLLVGEVPIQSDNTALINLPNELFTGDRRMKVQLTVASCDGERILNLQQFTDLKVINSLAPNEVVEPVYDVLINKLYDGDLTFVVEALNELRNSFETNNQLLDGAINSLIDSQRIINNSISSSKLKISSDADKIQMINLSDEVKKAMSGTTPISPILDDKSITNAKIADKTLSFGKMSDNRAIALSYFQQQSHDTNEIKNIINPDNIDERGWFESTTDMNTGTWRGGHSDSGIIKVKPSTKYSKSQGFNPDHFVTYFDINGDRIAAPVSSGVTFTTPSNCEYIRLVLSKGGEYNVSVIEGNFPNHRPVAYTKHMLWASDFEIDPEVISNKVNQNNRFVRMTSRIKFDPDNKIITVGSGTSGFVVNTSSPTYKFAPEQEIIFDIIGSKGDLCFITYDPKEFKYVVSNYASIPKDNYYVCWFVMRNAVLYSDDHSIEVSGNYSVESSFNKAFDFLENCILVGNKIDFDFTNKTITWGTSFVISNGKYYTPKNSYCNMSTTGVVGGIHGVWYDKTSGEIVSEGYRAFGQLKNKNNLVMLGAYFADTKSVQMLGNIYVDGKLVSGGTEALIFDKEKHRMVLSDDIFIVKGFGLNMYSESMFSESDNVVKNLTPYIITKDSYGVATTQYIKDNLFIDGEKYKDSVRIGFKSNDLENSFFQQNVTIHTKEVSDITNKTPIILCIGDSITNRRHPSHLKTLLTRFGVTATMIGTMANAGGQSGEGREGWEFENFIGADNTRGNNAGDRIVVQSVFGKDTSNLNLNPFLKVATDTDKQKYGKWCFRNTGVEREKSYIEDTDKSGDFYIFDMEHYISANNFSSPDVISIALSTNDFWQNGEAGITHSEEALEIMLIKIKEALPNVKVGVFIHVWGNNSSGHTYIKNHIPKLIDKMNAMLKRLKLNNVYVVPLWLHGSRETLFPLNAIGPVTSESSCIEYTMTDYVHYAPDGELCYADVNSQFVANML